MKILITGGAGFVGSNLAIMLKNKYPYYDITCLDNLKRKGSELNLPLLKSVNINFIHADIRNKEDLSAISHFDTIIDACADPSVLAGIETPIEQAVNTNLIGTLNCLELAKKYNSNFIFLSTSRVYPIKLINNIEYTEANTRFIWKDYSGINENFPLDESRSFYGFTKYASELLIKEYNYYHNIKSVINRCGVITGPGQMGKIDQGILVFWLAQHFWKKDLKYIGFGGKGKQVRDMLHIKDLFDLIDIEIHNMDIVNNKIYNVGGGLKSSVSLLELTELCQQVTGNIIKVEKSSLDRPGDIRIYITDNTKINTDTNWIPKYTSEDIVKETFDWIKDNKSLLKNILI
jgi:CDP-paratose 2-epimerase